MKRHLINRGIGGFALTALTVACSTVFAAEMSEPALEEIEVVGIARSIKSAIDTKRNSYQVSDGISAEDMGKFPDANLAEALQRVPGVSIDRDGGEGRFVSVRGMGPTFTVVTVNGREMASENEDRSFSFDTLAAELVSGVNVYKASSASQTEGGIGGVVDVKTAMPFDFDGFKAMGSLEANYEENSGETTPQGSVLVSNTFMDDRLGILGSLTYQKRETESTQVENEGVIHYTPREKFPRKWP